MKRTGSLFAKISLAVGIVFVLSWGQDQEADLFPVPDIIKDNIAFWKKNRHRVFAFRGRDS
jgi:hypothetical protein